MNYHAQHHFVKPSVLLMLLICLTGILQAQTEIDTLQTSTSDRALFALEGPDNGYIILGTPDSGGLVLPPFVARLDANKKVLWKTSTPFYSRSIKCNLALTADQKIVVAGESLNHIGVIGMDLDGNILWAKTITTGGMQSATLIFNTINHGNVILAQGTKKNAAETDSVLLYAIDNFGNNLWHKALLPPVANAGVFPTAIKEDLSTGSLYVLWNYNTNPSKWKGMLTRLNAAHDVLWTQELTDAVKAYTLTDLVQLPTHEMVVSGNLGYRSFLQAFDEEGNALWITTFFQPGGAYWLNDVEIVNNKIVAIGDAAFGSEFYMVQTDLSGVLEKDTVFGKESLVSIEKSGAGLIVSGTTVVGNQRKIVLLTLPGTQSVSTLPIASTREIPCYYPNPTTGQVYRSVEAVDIFAKAVIRVHDMKGLVLKIYPAGSAPEEIDLSAYPAGIYYMEILLPDGVLHSCKILKI